MKSEYTQPFLVCLSFVEANVIMASSLDGSGNGDFYDRESPFIV